METLQENKLHEGRKPTVDTCCPCHWNITQGPWSWGYSRDRRGQSIRLLNLRGNINVRSIDRESACLVSLWLDGWLLFKLLQPIATCAQSSMKYCQTVEQQGHSLRHARLFQQQWPGTTSFKFIYFLIFNNELSKSSEKVVWVPNTWICILLEGVLNDITNWQCCLNSRFRAFITLSGRVKRKWVTFEHWRKRL